MKRCEAYVGVACVNGCCSAALTEEYMERGMDVIRDYGGAFIIRAVGRMCPDPAGSNSLWTSLKGQGDRMEKHQLMEYRKLKHEQALLIRRIEALEGKEIPVVAGKVKASSREFPYTEHRISVQMSEPVAAERVRRMLRIYKGRQEKIGQQMLEVEDFIDGIADAETRQIFEMRFVEGMKQEEIAQRMNLERSSISKKITAYLQLSHNSQKSVI